MMWRLLGRLLQGRSPVTGTLREGLEALESGDADKALAIAEALGTADGTLPQAHYLRGLILEHGGALAEAVHYMRQACMLAPQEGVFHLALARMLERSGDAAASAMAFEAAFAAEDAPFADDAQVHFTAAGAHFRSGNPAKAIKRLRTAIGLRSGFVEARVNLARLLQLEGSLEEATAHMDRALALRPSAALRLRRALMLPPVFRSREHIAEVRADLHRRLDELLADAPYLLDDPAATVATAPFLLAYQGEDDKPLMAKLAQAIRKGLGPAAPMPRGPAAGDRLVVGLVSGSLYNHSVGRTVLELVKRLDRRRFRVVVFSMAPRDDAVSAAFSAAADDYVALPKAMAPLREAVGQRPCDILLYPDIGLDPETYFLAFERLAPLQCVLAGHPVTTGIDTVDCFLSGAAEPEGAAAHYTETLMSIPGFLLSICDPPPWRAGTPAAMGNTIARYLVPQTVVKLHPDFDDMLEAVLASDPHGEVWLYQSGSGNNEVVKLRLSQKLGDHYPRIRFLPRQNYREYLDTLSGCHVVLDTRHFGGGNTTLEALASGVPVVTWPGAFLRGRFAWDCCRRLDLQECIANSSADYAERAIQLARDSSMRADTLDKIRSGRDALFPHQDLASKLGQTLLGMADGITKPGRDILN